MKHLTLLFLLFLSFSLSKAQISPKWLFEKETPLNSSIEKIIKTDNEGFYIVRSEKKILKDIWAPYLEQYNAKGKLIKTIKLKVPRRKPFIDQVIMFDNKLVIVYGKWKGFRQVSDAWIYDFKGNVLASNLEMQMRWLLEDYTISPNGKKLYLYGIHMSKKKLELFEINTKGEIADYSTIFDLTENISGYSKLVVDNNRNAVLIDKNNKTLITYNIDQQKVDYFPINIKVDIAYSRPIFETENNILFAGYSEKGLFYIEFDIEKNKILKTWEKGFTNEEIRKGFYIDGRENLRKHLAPILTNDNILLVHQDNSEIYFGTTTAYSSSREIFKDIQIFNINRKTGSYTSNKIDLYQSTNDLGIYSGFLPILKENELKIYYNAQNPKNNKKKEEFPETIRDMRKADFTRVTYNIINNTITKKVLFNSEDEVVTVAPYYSIPINNNKDLLLYSEKTVKTINGLYSPDFCKIGLISLD